MLIALLAAGACRNDASIAEPAYAYAVATDDCAPFGGPAVRITLANAPVQLDQAPPPYLSIYLWVSGTQAEEQRIDIGGTTGKGSVQFCPASGECTEATGGMVRFSHPMADTVLRGEYVAGFPDGTRQTGRFHASWQGRTLICF